MEQGEVLPLFNRGLVFCYLRQRCHTRRTALSDGWASTIHSSDDGDEDQGEGQPGLREGDGDSDPAVPSGAARAQLWSYAILLEVLKRDPTRYNLDGSQILRSILTFCRSVQYFLNIDAFSVTIPYAGSALSSGGPSSEESPIF